MSIQNLKLRVELLARLESLETWLIDQHNSMESDTPAEVAEEYLDVIAHVQAAMLWCGSSWTRRQECVLNLKYHPLPVVADPWLAEAAAEPFADADA